jgi:hypothetical protein
MQELVAKRFDEAQGETDMRRDNVVAYSPSRAMPRGLVILGLAVLAWGIAIGGGWGILALWSFVRSTL